MTIEEYLQSVEAREKAATKGPWDADNWETTVQTDDQIVCVATTANRSADSPFIANARQDIPNLLLLVRKYREALENGVMFCERYQNADIEGADSEALQADSDRTVNAVCKQLSDALQFDPRKGQE